MEVYTKEFDFYIRRQKPLVHISSETFESSYHILSVCYNMKFRICLRILIHFVRNLKSES